MAGKSLIGGTAYTIAGGKTLINGTVYSIKGGKTLINGTLNNIVFAPPIASNILYELGEQNVAVTGGWKTGVKQALSWNVTNAIFNADSITMNAGAGSNLCPIATINKIPTSRYSWLKVEGSGTRGSQNDCLCWGVYNSNVDGFENSLIIRGFQDSSWSGVLAFNIQSVSQDGYVILFSYRSSKNTIKKIWLE